MKVYKKNEHSLFLKPFGIGDRLYLALTVFIYFDLTAPDDPLTEQELWKTIPEKLKPTPVLDLGMPKPRAEVLVTGSCFAPRGTTRNASRISVTVGDLKKELSVFGDRYWTENTAGLTIISEPASFSEMPVTWNNAFGGGGFDKNPAGKGIELVLKPEGGSQGPLPNVEHPAQLIGAPTDRPEPACMDAVDLMRPQRQKKAGTYDDRWLKERWPYFPSDMNYEFFNCAPEDQFLDGFFSGDEAIEIFNMHPDMQFISSCLPGIRIRCFVTKKKPESDTETFEDVSMHVDTLWLFPSILRGVLMYRGTTEIFDEEYEDVVRIFVATERLKDPPGSVDYYLEEQRKVMDRSVPVDMAPFQKAAKNIGDMMKRVRKIPKDIDDAVKRSTGRAPVMPRSPAETAAQGHKVLSDSLALLDRLEAQSKDLHSKYGHLVRLDLGMFDRMRRNLKKTGDRIDEGLEQIEAASGQVKKSAQQVAASASEKVEKSVPPDVLEKSGFRPDSFLPGARKVNPWHDRGFPFVVKCRKRLENDEGVIKCLKDLGFDSRSMRRAWLGINTEEIKEDSALWGLEKSSGGTEKKNEVLIPRGLVMPRFDEATLNRVLVMPEGWQDGENLSKGLVVEGSAEAPLWYPADKGAPVVAAADELQALLLEQEIGDACSVIVLESPSQKPPEDAEAEIGQSDAFLIILPATCAEGDPLQEKWRGAFPNARPYPFPKGKTLFEARKEGLDIRKWIMDALPKDFVEKNKVAPEFPEAGGPPTAKDLAVPIPEIDVKALVEKSGKEIRGFLEKQTGDIASMAERLKSQLVLKAGGALAKAGINPDQAFKPQQAPRPVSPAGIGETMAKKLEDHLQVMKNNGTLTPELDRSVSQGIEHIRKMSREAQVRYDQGMARLESAKKTLDEASTKAKAQEMPEAGKKKFKKFGMDSDRMVKRTRDEVIEMHRKGDSLAFAKLSGVDLSGLDLQGIDLRQAECRKTDFTGSILDGADLTQVMAIEADFSGSSLKKATLDRAMFIKAGLKGSNLSGSEMTQATFKDSDLSGADFSGASLQMTTIMGTALAKTRFCRMNANLCVFSDASAAGADFEKCRLERCLLRKLSLDDAGFSGAALPSTTFMEDHGERVSFRYADMHKTRMNNGTKFPGADVRDVSFTQGSLRETDLSNGDFTGACLDNSLLEKCDLTGARLCRISAKTCRFSKSNMENADMRFINLFSGSLRKSRLVGADLRGANLYAVDFYKSVMGGTKMEGANVKKSLLFKRLEFLKDDGRIE